MAILRAGETSVPRSGIVGNSWFSLPEDYESYALSQGWESDVAAVWSNPTLVREIQTHWYWQGQVGCLFARRFARKPEIYGWRRRVVGEDDLVEFGPSRLYYILEEELCYPCELVSFIFPSVRTTDKLIALITTLISGSIISLVSADDISGVTALSLQMSLPGTGVKAWMLGLGPFRYLPMTRRAPSTEIIVRPKAKPGKLFHRVNQDRSIAHIADAPLHMSDDYAEIVWQETIPNVAKILSRRPDKLSAAKTTFCVPSNFWR